MDIWMDEKWSDGWVNLYRGGLVVGLINIFLYRWIDGWVDEWMD